MQQQAKKGIQKNETVTKNSSVFQEHKTMLPSLLNSDMALKNISSYILFFLRRTQRPIWWVKLIYKFQIKR